MTDFEMPAGTFSTRPNIIVSTGSEDPGFVDNDWIGPTVVIGDTVRLAITEPCPRCVMITLPQGRPTQRLRNPQDGRSTQRSKRRRLCLGDQWRNHPPRRHGRARLSWD